MPGWRRSEPYPQICLDDLSTELAARGARAELFLVGGAALAVAYDAIKMRWSPNSVRPHGRRVMDS